MKPQFDGVRAFAIYMESGNEGLKEYVSRLNAEHFKEDGTTPKTSEPKPETRLNPDAMKYNEIVAELKRRGIEKYGSDRELARFSKEEAIERLKRDIAEEDATKPEPKPRVTTPLKLRDIKSDDEDAFSEKALYLYLQDNPTLERKTTLQ